MLIGGLLRLYWDGSAGNTRKPEIYDDSTGLVNPFEKQNNLLLCFAMALVASGELE
jgi:hypothetical protein